VVKPLAAMAEDFRRVGVAGIIAGLVGSFLEETIQGTVGLAAVVLGMVLNLIGYWLHRQPETRE